MAERRNKLIRKVDSAEVQGEGSFVKVRTMTMADVQAIEAELAGNKDKDAWGQASLRRSILEWDWVDDEGQPLPLPSEQPDILDSLPMPELDFLFRALNLDAEKSKN